MKPSSSWVTYEIAGSHTSSWVTDLMMLMRDLSKMSKNWSLLVQLIAYLSSYHEKAIKALYELA